MDEESVLMVITGAADPARPEQPGLNRASFSGPWALLSEPGWDVTVASPHGEPVAGVEPPASIRSLEAVWETDFRAILVAGGSGALVDLADNPLLISLIERSHRQSRPVAAVAEGVTALVGCKTRNDGALVQSRRLTCPVEAERSPAAPFDLELRLRQLGAWLEHRQAGDTHVVKDGLLITGQNPESALDATRSLVAAMEASGSE